MPQHVLGLLWIRVLEVQELVYNCIGNRSSAVTVYAKYEIRQQNLQLLLYTQNKKHVNVIKRNEKSQHIAI